MGRKDIARQFDYFTSCAYADRTATITGSEVNITGAKEVLVLVYVVSNTTSDASNLFTFTVTEASATGGSFSAAASTAYDPVDSWDRLINATTETGLYAFNFKPTQPYIKVVATETGTAQVAFSAHVLITGIHQPEST
jgi:hypothetical protein